MAAIQCPKCSRALSVSTLPAGGGLKCPLCGAVFAVPAAVEPPSAARASSKPQASTSTGQEGFDPYYTWLGIPPHEQPPNHYRLLGLALFEANPDVIDNAASRQANHLRSVSTGPRAAFAQVILNRVAAAKICLLDVGRKAEYDAGLHNQVATKAAEMSRQPAAPAMQPQTKRPKPKDPKLELLKIVLGGLVGLAAGYGVLWLLYPEVVGRGEKKSVVINEAETESKSPIRNYGSESANKSTSSPVESSDPDPVVTLSGDETTDPFGSSTTTNNPPIPSTSALPTNRSPSPTDGTFPTRPNSKSSNNTKKTNNRTSQTQPSLPDPIPQPAKIAQVPSSVALPPAEATVWTTLMPLPTPPEKLELIPAFDPVVAKLSLSLEAESGCAAASWLVKFARVEESGNVQGVLAGIQVDSSSGELQFRWQGRDTAAAAGLSNSWLKVEIESESKYVALRQPQSIPAIKLDLEKERLIIPLAVDSIPNIDQLYLELSDLTKVHGSASFKNGNSMAKFDREVVIEFKDLPGAEVGIKFAKIPQAPLGFIVEPRFKEGASREYDLTLPKLEKTQKALQDAIQEAKIKIPILSRNVSDAETLYRRVDGTSTSKNYTPRQKQIDLVKANGVIRDATRRLNAMREQETAAQGRLGRVPQLADFMRKLHGNEIEFRVLVRAVSAELVLVTGTIGGATN